MTATKHISLTCDWCRRSIVDGEQYYRLDTMMRGTATLWGDRQLKHICCGCIPSVLSIKYKPLCKNQMSTMKYENSLGGRR